MAVGSRLIEYLHGLGFCTVALDHLALFDINLRRRDPACNVLWQTQCLRKECRIQSAYPIAQAKCSVLCVQAIIEREDGMAWFRSDRLYRVRVRRWKIPKITGTVVGNFSFTLRIDDGHLAMAGQNVRPFRGIVPVHLANPARVEIKVCAGDVGSNGERFGGDVAGPTTRGRLDGGLVQ